MDGDTVKEIANVFGIKAAVEGGVDLVKARWLPIMIAKGEERARLIKLRGEFEYRKEINRLAILEKAENKLRDAGTEPRPIAVTTLMPFLEAAGLVTDETLQDLWASLLSGNSVGKVPDQRMAIFRTVLSQLTTCDALFLKLIVDSSTLADFEEGSPLIVVGVDAIKATVAVNASWVVDLQMKRAEDVYPLDNEITRDNVSFTVQNLVRVGVLHHTPQDRLKETYDYYLLTLTQFGRQFLQAVGLTA